MSSWIPPVFNFLLSSVEFFVVHENQSADQEHSSPPFYHDSLSPRKREIRKLHPELSPPLLEAYALFETTPTEATEYILTRKYCLLLFLENQRRATLTLVWRSPTLAIIDKCLCLLLNDLDCGERSEESIIGPTIGTLDGQHSGLEVLKRRGALQMRLKEFRILKNRVAEAKRQDEEKVSVAHPRSLQDTEEELSSSTQGCLEEGDDDSMPKVVKPRMWLCRDDKAVALRHGIHDAVPDLVSDELTMEFVQRFEDQIAYLDSNEYKTIVKDYLLRSLDAEGNTLLHYVVRFDSSDGFDFVTKLARLSGNLPEVILNKNACGQLPLDFRDECARKTVIPARLERLTIISRTQVADQQLVLFAKKTLWRVCVIFLHASSIAASHLIGKRVFGMKGHWSVLGIVVANQFGRYAEDVVSILVSQHLAYYLFHNLPWQVCIIVLPLCAAAVMLLSSYCLWTPKAAKTYRLEVPWIIGLYWFSVFGIPWTLATTTHTEAAAAAIAKQVEVCE